MDSLTHIVFGAALGEAVLGKKAGKKAMLWGAIANTIPDLDVFLVFGDPIREITIHRGFSHSILFALLAAPILGWFINKLYKDKLGFRAWTVFFLICILTHPLLDSFTTYGTQLLLPFSDYRVTFANLFIIDFVYTLPMLVAFIACLILKRDNPKRIKWNRAGLYISTAYLALSIVSKSYANYVFTNSLAEKNVKITNCMTGVTPFNILLWYAVAETDSGYYVGYYSFLDKDKNIDYSFIKRNEEAIADIKKEYAVNRLIWFSNNYYAVEKVNDEIRFFTLKFGTPGYKIDGPISDAVPFYYIIKKQDDGTIKVENHQGFDKLELGKALKQLYHRVLGDKEAFKP